MDSTDMDFTDSSGEGTGEGEGEVNSIGEKTMVENGVGLDSMGNSLRKAEENHVGASSEKLENLMNLVGEEREDVSNVGVDAVAYMVVESGDLMNSRMEENEVEENLMKRAGENHVDVGVISVEGVENEKRVEVNDVGVEDVGAMNSAGEKRLGENNAAVDSVENSMPFVNKRVEENGVEGNSVGLLEGGAVGEKRLAVNDLDGDSVNSTQVESGDVTNSVDEKRSGENDVDMDLMNSTTSLEEKNAVNFPREEVESLKTKRAAENSVDDDLGKNKKARINISRDMRRVAEIVMVLSAMGNMRGGRSPTASEKEIMAEAREKLVGLCEGMIPKDIVPRDAVRVVIEDLGLNKSRDQRLSFRPPMTSIKEKLELAKRKIEESKKFAQQSGMHSSQTTHTGIGANNENHGAFVHANQRFPPDRPSHNAVVVGGSETTFSTVSRGSFSSPLERDASSLPLPRAEAVHFRLDGRSNMSAYPSQVRANHSGDHSLGKTPTSSPQVQLGAVPRVGVANKVPERTPVISASHVASLDTRDRNSNHSATQTAYGSQQAVQQPLQGFVQASPTYSNHSEIAKSVQKFLHPRLPERPSWTPPSTDYMNKSLTCQACKESVNDVESLLVCDACEKGNHIKCLQAYNQKGIPKGEWHCPSCLIASHGKPLPPKYGRVTRNNSAPKVSSNAAAVQASAEKVENSDYKVNHQTTTGNGNPGSLHSSHVVRTGNIHVAAPAGLKMSNVREVQTANSSGSKVKMDDNALSEHKSLPKDMSGPVCALSSGKPNERTNQQFQSCQPSSSKPEVSVPDPKSLPKVEPSESRLHKSSEAGIGTFHSSQTPCSSQDVGKSLRPKIAEASSDQYNNKVPNSRDTSDCKPGLDVRKDGQDAAQAVSVGNVGVGNGARDCLKSSLDGLHSVDWVGDILNVVDEKAYYTSCHINGMVYKLQDHALFSNNGNLRPSKLQALWEDTKTGSKWAIVNSCYFPADLPEVVGRPCSPENNEVYESNHGSTVRAGLVHGPCEVLPPNKFKEESERRIHSDDGSQPVFLCKWFYDESKGLFRPVTD